MILKTMLSKNIENGSTTMTAQITEIISNNITIYIAFQDALQYSAKMLTDKMKREILGAYGNK